MNDEYRIEVDTGSGGYGLQIRQQNFLQMSNLNMEKKKQKSIVLQEEVKLEETIQITSMVKFLRRLSILTLLQLQEKLMTI